MEKRVEKRCVERGRGSLLIAKLQEIKSIKLNAQAIRLVATGAEVGKAAGRVVDEGDPALSKTKPEFG